MHIIKKIFWLTIPSALLLLAISFFCIKALLKYPTNDWHFISALIGLIIVIFLILAYVIAMAIAFLYPRIKGREKREV